MAEPTKEKLTDTLVENAFLPAGTVDAVIWDSVVPSFGLNIRTGGKSCCLSYRPLGMGSSADTQRMKLASLDAMPKVAQARKVALMALGDVGHGALK